jgi:HAD superfamily hydrolase (TIGR01549 family)
MITNYIWDFDGVIINSHEVQVKALTDSYKTVGLKGLPPYEEFFKLSGNSLSNIFNQLGLPQEMVPIYRKISTENIGLITLHPGMEDVLKKVKDMGYGNSLNTGKDRKRTIEILKHFHMEEYFDIIVCSDDVENSKPHPESLNCIMEKLGWKCENTCMIGDGINDILAAQNAGVCSVAVTWGDVSADNLIACHPSVVVDTAEELVSFITKGGTL